MLHKRFADRGERRVWSLKIILCAAVALAASLTATAAPYRLKAVLTDSVGTPQEFITWRIITAEADSASQKMMAQIPKAMPVSYTHLTLPTILRV